jgi:hypothetical protein
MLRRIPGIAVEYLLTRDKTVLRDEDGNEIMNENVDLR